MMNQLLRLIICLMFLASPALADQKIYDPKRPVLPKYVVRDRANGSKAVYDSRNPVLPKYIVKPTRNGYKVYDAGKPVLSRYEVQGDTK